ncbi:MAG: hypothetical protein HQ527_04340 [Cyanobacteria bacterium]|nr:hypothetical protein [Cyanobacteria bacterium bin.51]
MVEAATAPTDSLPHRYPIAPLIRLTLITLYLALVLPLPLLAPDPLQPWLLAALPLGLALVLALLSEEALLDGDGIRVSHPQWCRWFLRRGWKLSWPDIRALVPVSTSQNGTVYYVMAKDRMSFLLPQRVARFEDFLIRFEAATGLKTTTIQRLTPPWTYWTLAALSGLLLGGELLTFALAPDRLFELARIG